MKKQLLTWLAMGIYLVGYAQPNRYVHSSAILQRMQKLNVLGSVLYIAAHPDDENTRLLGYLANERHYRTGYLSLTRGDGGQNLIGDEQGIDLGLIRTQELLAARRVDGAEQFFTSAFDFGYSKSPEEALRIWGKEQILSEMVWVIRQFKPDIIITRFPTTGEGGHGHHTASALLAAEAFDAAADPGRFPEQIKAGLSVWQAKRLLWNTFNFGNTNTQREDQFKLDVGQFNPLMGMSYGEVAAISRSQHKSQGFGVPSQRGTVYEYFSALKGNQPVADIMEDIVTGWQRLGYPAIEKRVASIIDAYKVQSPQSSLAGLAELHRLLTDLPASYWRDRKKQEVEELMVDCSGLFLEAISGKQLQVTGDSMRISLLANNRLGAPVSRLKVEVLGNIWTLDSLPANQNQSDQMRILLPVDFPPSQPFWLERGLHNGRFVIDDPALTGMAQTETAIAGFSMNIAGRDIQVKKPVRFKYTDPVKGELIQPVQFVQPLLVNVSPSLLIFSEHDTVNTKKIQVSIQAKRALQGQLKPFLLSDKDDMVMPVIEGGLQSMQQQIVSYDIKKSQLPLNGKQTFRARVTGNAGLKPQYHALRKISYDHIPEIYYHFADQATALRLDLKISGRRIGYIVGAGDRVPEALEQMGYKVTILKESDISMPSLLQFDALVTGVRAYNVHEWLTVKYDVLMNYVREGGVLLCQYNTNSGIGPLKANIAPYPFQISRNRITDEQAPVKFLKPDHPVLNTPNKINQSDFSGWVQERSVYHAEQTDPAYNAILSMNDPGEKEHSGALIVADYGKGRFIYTGLSLFRQLPAAVPGAFRLLANLLAKPNSR